MPSSKVIKIKKAEYLGELMWGDFDLIFPIMDLYQNSIWPRVSASRASEEMLST